MHGHSITCVTSSIAKSIFCLYLIVELEFLIEAKVSDSNLSSHLAFFAERIPGARFISAGSKRGEAQMGVSGYRSSAEWLTALKT